MEALDSGDPQERIRLVTHCSSAAFGRFKRVRQARPQLFFARSVRVVREHGKKARTLLADFFKRPIKKSDPIQIEK